MDLFKRIQDLSSLYDDDGPSATVQESRPMFNDGGRTGFSEGTDIENLSKVHEELRGKYPGVQIRFNKVIGRKGRPSLSINTETSYKPLLKDLKKVYYANELEDFKKQVTKAAEILEPEMKKSAEAKKKRTSKLGLYEREGAYGDRKTVVKQVNQIIEDIASSKRPITDVSKLVQGKLIDSPIKKTSNFVTIDSRTGKPLYLTEKNLKLYKEKIFPKLSSIKSRLGAKAVAPDVLEGLKNLTVDNFDAFYEKNPPFKMKIDMPKNIGEKIISTLERHSTLGGEKFKLISGETFKNFKIKDLNTNEILTADKVNELVEKGDPRFKEFKKVQDQVNKLKKTEYINPVTKQKTTLFKALQLATGDLFPIHIDHIKGVRSEPLKFLNPLLSKTNIGKDTAQTVDELKKIGARSVLPGKTYAQGAVVSFDKKTNDLIKFANRKILQTEASGFEKPKTVKKILNIEKNISATQSKGIAKKLADSGFECILSRKSGGTINCNDPRAYTQSIKENMARVQQGDNASVAKVNKLGKAMNGFKGAAKFTGWGLLTELGFAAPLAAVDYAKGANKDEIISNATYGLFGKSEEEQLKEKYADYGQAQKFQDTYDKLLNQESALDDQTGYGPIINPQNIENTEKKLIEQSKAFNTILPPSMGFKGDFDLDMFFNAQALDQKRREEFAKEKEQRSKEIGILKPSTGLEAVELAGGGIAKMAGDRSGAMTRSMNPDSQGLSYLFNRVKKV